MFNSNLGLNIGVNLFLNDISRLLRLFYHHWCNVLGVRIQNIMNFNSLYVY
jgi:hypothetical protein